MHSSPAGRDSVLGAQPFLPDGVSSHPCQSFSCQEEGLIRLGSVGGDMELAVRPLCLPSGPSEPAGSGMFTFQSPPCPLCISLWSFSTARLGDVRG